MPPEPDRRTGLLSRYLQGSLETPYLPIRDGYELRESRQNTRAISALNRGDVKSRHSRAVGTVADRPVRAAFARERT